MRLLCFSFEQRADDRDRTLSVRKNLTARKREGRVFGIVAREFEQSTAWSSWSATMRMDHF